LLSVAKLIKQFRDVHGDKYDYSLITKPMDKRDKVDIICRNPDCFHASPKHPFHQTCNNHLRGGKNGESGNGCPKCGERVRIAKMTKSQKEFVADAENKWGAGVYNYDDVVYVNAKTPVRIRCMEHPDRTFLQAPNNHLNGFVGCPHCNRRRMSEAAHVWLPYMRIVDSTEIQDAFSEQGEYALPELGIQVTGFSSALNKVYRYFVCYSRGCQKCGAGKTRKINGKEYSSLELYEKTQAEAHQIQQAGYEYSELWECEYLKRIDEMLSLLDVSDTESSSSETD
jgi:hypothetical protein